MRQLLIFNSLLPPLCRICLLCLIFSRKSIYISLVMNGSKIVIRTALSLLFSTVCLGDEDKNTKEVHRTIGIELERGFSKKNQLLLL